MPTYNAEKMKKEGLTRKMVPLARLQGPHHETLVRAIVNVLQSPVARTTFAQVLDGLPLSSVAMDKYDDLTCTGHPLLEKHLELSAEVLAKLDEAGANLELDTLRLDATAFYDYGSAGVGSSVFKTRLIELVARAVHAIAVFLYQHGPLRPQDDPLMAWRPDADEDLKRDYYRDGFPPTLLSHKWYTAYDLYPDGAADVVGYWAEERILGGVVLFDRREPGSVPVVKEDDFDPDHPPSSAPAFKSDAVYYHSDAHNTTYRIYRLTDEQKQQLLQFLLSETHSPTSACPLPIHGNESNRIRVDPEDPMKETGIYRDKWERPPLTNQEQDKRVRDVIDLFNYVSEDEFSAAYWRGEALQYRIADECATFGSEIRIQQMPSDAKVRTRRALPPIVRVTLPRDSTAVFVKVTMSLPEGLVSVTKFAALTREDTHEHQYATLADWQRHIELVFDDTTIDRVSRFQLRVMVEAKVPSPGCDYYVGATTSST